MSDQQAATSATPTAPRWPYADLTDEEFCNLLKQAAAELRAKYPDYDLLRPARDAIAGILELDWSKLTLYEAGEMYYLLARYSTFAAPWRESALAAFSDLTGDQLLRQALEDIRHRFPDFDSLQKAMLTVANALTPTPGLITLAEFIELCYCTAKHSSFCKPARERIAFERSVPISTSKM